MTIIAGQEHNFRVKDGASEYTEAVDKRPGEEKIGII
tara:strand:- start:12 stop:122 length:111 start_codon:yes stop_codon:yes gene_type:complete